MEGWIYNNGVEPDFLLSGGTVDVLFEDGSIARKVTLDNRCGCSNEGNHYCARNWKLRLGDASIKAWKPSYPEQGRIAGEAIVESGDFSKHNHGFQPIKITKDCTYTLNIKGHVITLTEDEFQHLLESLDEI